MFKLKAESAWRRRLKQLFDRSGGEALPADELEALLYEADLSSALVSSLMKQAGKTSDGTRESVMHALQETVVSLYGELEVAETFPPPPAAWLLLGVNGTGKTSLAGKLAKRMKTQGAEVVLAAADTFRAGAIRQLQIWGERIGVEVVAGAPGGDPAAVVFDAWQRAQKLGAFMIADTAGRMHTQVPLVEQLQKVVRILGRDGSGAPHESFLVLDGMVGQNAISQSAEFVKVAPLTGLAVTKLDGTARGGAILAAALQLALPIRYVGVGESEDDLVPFDVRQFAQELLSV